MGGDKRCSGVGDVEANSPISFDKIKDQCHKVQQLKTHHQLYSRPVWRIQNVLMRIQIRIQLSMLMHIRHRIWLRIQIQDVNTKQRNKISSKSSMDLDPWKMLWVRIQQIYADPLDMDHQHCSRLLRQQSWVQI